MQKQETLALLKEILNRQSTMLNWVSINEAQPGKYEIIIKGTYDKQIIDIIAREKNLTIKENNNTLSIS